MENFRCRGVIVHRMASTLCLRVEPRIESKLLNLLVENIYHFAFNGILVLTNTVSRQINPEICNFRSIRYSLQYCDYIVRRRA